MTPEVRETQENMELYLQFLRRQDQVKIAERVQQLLGQLVKMDQDTEERQKLLEELAKQIASHKADIEYQATRVEMAKQAADDAINVYKQMVQEAQSKYDDSMAKLDAAKAAYEKSLEDRRLKGESDLRMYLAQMDTSKQEAQRDYAEAQRKALDEIAKRDGIQDEIHKLQAKFNTLFS